MKHEEIMTINEVAVALGVSTATIYLWRQTGKHQDVLPVRSAGRRTYYCHRSDVERFIASQGEGTAR